MLRRNNEQQFFISNPNSDEASDLDQTICSERTPTPQEQQRNRQRENAVVAINNFFKKKLPKIRIAIKSAINSGVYKPEVLDAVEEFATFLGELEDKIDPNSRDPQEDFNTNISPLLLGAKRAIQSIPMADQVNLLTSTGQPTGTTVQGCTDSLLLNLTTLTPPTTWYRDARRSSTSSMRASIGGESDGAEADIVISATKSSQDKDKDRDELPLCYRCVIW